MIFFTPDSLHINKNNFSSLLSFINKENHVLECNKEYKELITRYGNYEGYTEIFYEYKKQYLQYPKDYLKSASCFGINLFFTCRAELLTLLVTKKEFFNLGYKWSNEQLFDFIFKNFYEELINNISAVAFWLDIWNNYIKNNKIDIALIFSGSLIYERTLSYLLRRTQTRVFILESYFSGNDFYCEERFSPISNDSLLKYPAYYDSITLDSNEIHKDYIKSLNKYILQNNLNVKQPTTNDKIFLNSKKIVAVLGQVVNDFSILEHNSVGFNSILVYKNIMRKILNNTDYNIVFKGHPWEYKKENLKTAFTLNFLKNEFFVENNKRLIFIDNYNINDLINQVDYVITLNSQSGIDAAWNGLKPIVLANPFYGNKGFTYDLSYDDLESVCNLLNNTHNSNLELSEFNKFEEFLIKSFQYHLVSKFPSGEKRLREIFTQNLGVSLAKKINKIEKDIKTEIKNENKTLLKKKELHEDKKNSSRKNINKKFIKLKNNPKKFFMDSKFKFFRAIGKIF